MSEIVVNDVSYKLNEEGYLIDTNSWNRDLAVALAKDANIELTEEHFKVLEYIRDEYAKGTALTIRKVGKSGIVDIKGLYRLFPGGPLKLSSKFAGIPKPSSCV